MLAVIVLPAGKDRITIAEIPALFANAIHPALPGDTPRQITAFKKYPLTEENSREWCGANSQPFPVSLTADDMAELNRSVWISLPQLKLPINEPEWQPYRVALEKNPPKDWKLKEDWLNRVMLNRDNWHDTVEVYLTEVRQAAMRGHLVPRSNATLLPLPGAIGELLLDCLVTLENFVSFAARFEIDVRVAEVVLEPQAIPMVTESASDGETQSIEQIRYAVLASRTELIDAFSFYGVERKIFKALNDRPGLKAACRVKGKGQKGSTAEPMFCPFEVISWLVKTGVKDKPQLTDFTGWHILETKFPNVYSEKSICDPR